MNIFNPYSQVLMFHILSDEEWDKDGPRDDAPIYHRGEWEEDGTLWSHTSKRRGGFHRLPANIYLESEDLWDYRFTKFHDGVVGYQWRSPWVTETVCATPALSWYVECAWVRTGVKMQNNGARNPRHITRDESYFYDQEFRRRVINTEVEG